MAKINDIQFRNEKELKREIERRQPILIYENRINPQADKDVAEEGQFAFDSDQGKLYFKAQGQLSLLQSGVSPPVEVWISGGGGGSGQSGTMVHNVLNGRDAENCHPISSITGLREQLNMVGRNIDGGSANSVYLAIQSVDGGGAFG